MPQLLTGNGLGTGEYGIASGQYSRNDWLRLHNHAAAAYINSEWSREKLLGVAARRKELFAHATGRVLDVGCGYGINFPYLINASEIVGVDFSPVMLAKAREKLRRSSIPVDLREGDAEALDFRDDSFDTVISSLSTCSFYNPLMALSEIRRVCKPDGRILLIEHGRSSVSWLGKYQDRHLQEQIDQGGCRWNQEPQELITQSGLRILSEKRHFLGVFHTMTIAPEKGGL